MKTRQGVPVCGLPVSHSERLAYDAESMIYKDSVIDREFGSVSAAAAAADQVVFLLPPTPIVAFMVM